jgi:hypothetical protein
MTTTTKSVMHYAAVRANATRLARKAETFTHPVAKMAIAEALRLYEVELKDAPARRVRTTEPADRHLAAIRANETRLAKRAEGFTNKIAREAIAEVFAARNATA